MATLRGILGQSFPSSATLTDIYTVPASKSAVFKVIATNTVTTDQTFRVSIALLGAADQNKQYIAYDVPILGSDTGSTVAVTAQTGAVVRVESSLGSVAFTVTGLEQDA